MTVQIKNRRSSTSTIVFRSEPNPETDLELQWLFTCSETAIGVPSNWTAFADAALSGGRGDHGVEADSMEEVLARTFAMNRARIIVGWLEAMPPPLMAVLVAAYEPRAWPAHYELKLGRLAGVVATLPRYAQALAAYRKARGTRACLVKDEEVES